MTYEDIIDYLLFIPAAVLALVAVGYVVRAYYKDRKKGKED